MNDSIWSERLLYFQLFFRARLIHRPNDGGSSLRILTRLSTLTRLNSSLSQKAVMFGPAGLQLENTDYGEHQVSSECHFAALSSIRTASYAWTSPGFTGTASEEHKAIGIIKSRYVRSVWLPWGSHPSRKMVVPWNRQRLLFTIQITKYSRLVMTGWDWSLTTAASTGLLFIPGWLRCGSWYDGIDWG
jgi:hypothetical protein